MKVAASNIGWAHEASPTMLPELQRRGVEGLVVAPSMVWPGAPDTVRPEQAREFRSSVEDAGLHIVGMQSLTFGMGEGLTLASPEVTDRLKRQAELAGHLGATSLVLGSPNLRQSRPDRCSSYTTATVVDALTDVARVAADNNTKLCIEPLSGYGVQHVTNTAEGVQLTWFVSSDGIKASKGFGLHLDSAALAGNPGFEPSLEIPYAQVRAIGGITSFDVSAPNLMPPSQDTTVPHQEIAAALRSTSERSKPFTGFVSLEMRPPQPAEGQQNFDPVAAYLAEVDFVREQYGFQQ